MCVKNLLEVSLKTKTVLLNLRNKVSVFFVMLIMFNGAAVLALVVLKGPVVLQVSGLIEAHNQGKVAALDMKALQGLPQKSFTTQTPLYQKHVTFRDPLLLDVSQPVNVKGQHIRAVVLNNCWVKLPVTDAREHDVVVAVQMNAKATSVLTKGSPVFIAYPFEAQKEHRHETDDERSIWQLKAIEVV